MKIIDFSFSHLFSNNSVYAGIEKASIYLKLYTSKIFFNLACSNNANHNKSSNGEINQICWNKVIEIEFSILGNKIINTLTNSIEKVKDITKCSYSFTLIFKSFSLSLNAQLNLNELIFSNCSSIWTC